MVCPRDGVGVGEAGVPCHGPLPRWLLGYLRQTDLPGRGSRAGAGQEAVAVPLDARGKCGARRADWPTLPTRVLRTCVSWVCHVLLLLHKKAPPNQRLEATLLPSRVWVGNLSWSPLGSCWLQAGVTGKTGRPELAPLHRPFPTPTPHWPKKGTWPSSGSRG